MPDEQISYLEPIDEGDLGFEKKMGHVDGEVAVSPSIETPSAPESAPEHAEVKTEKEATYQKILAATQASQAQTDDQAVDDDAQAVSEKMDADSQVQQLVDLAMSKGLVHAVRVTQKLGDFYVLDKVHDELVNRLYDALVEKGLVENE